MNTPEHDKLRAIKDESQLIGAFLEWLGENGYSLCRYEAFTRHSGEPGDYTPSGYYPTPLGIEDLLARFFDIDLDKLEEEKQAILQQLQESRP